MDVALLRFFDALAAMLDGRCTAVQVEHELGDSPSGTAALGFYAELVSRNLHKIMVDVFPLLRGIVGPQWRALVERYLDEHPPRGVDPNGVAASFSSWLARCETADRRWAELADFEWLQVAAHHASDGAADDDGFDRRLFVRLYSFDVPSYLAAVARDPTTDTPIDKPTPIVVFRHTETLCVRVHRPGAFALAVLARRQAVELPPALAGVDPARLLQTEAELVAQGMLVPNSPTALAKERSHP